MSRCPRCGAEETAGDEFNACCPHCVGTNPFNAPLVEAPIKDVKEIRFYSSKGEYGFLSNFYPCRIYFGIEVFESVEHAYQSCKPNDSAIIEWIKNAPYPRLAFVAGHNLFQKDIIDDWMEVRVKIMKNLLTCCKFYQHPDLADKLLATGDAVLIENSPIDSFWGVGADGEGENMLGKLLMEARKKLKKEREEERK